MEVSQTSRLYQLQDRYDQIDSQIKGLKAELKTVINAAREHAQILKSINGQIQGIEGLQSKIKSIGTPDSPRYLRHSEHGGITFSAHRGLKEHLCMGNGGAPRATEIVEGLLQKSLGMAPHQKVNTGELSRQLGDRLQELEQHKQTLINDVGVTNNAWEAVKSKLEVLDRDQGIVHSQLAPLIKAHNRRADELQAMKKAAVLVYGSNEGARYINYLCRQERGVWQGEPPAKPAAADIYNFYVSSSKESDSIAMFSKDREAVKKVLDSPAPQILQLFDKALADAGDKRAERYENFRGARISESELERFKQALASKSLLQNAFYMSVTPDFDTAEGFAEGKYHGERENGVSVMFKVQAPSIPLNTAYELESIVKPDTCFEVTKIAAPFTQGNWSRHHVITLMSHPPTSQASGYF